MKLLFKFMNFVTLNGFILNENEVKFPQKKNSLLAYKSRLVIDKGLL